MFYILSLDSKYGRPPAKKVKDRKPSTRLASNSNTPSDITGSSFLLAFRVLIFYHIQGYQDCIIKLFAERISTCQLFSFVQREVVNFYGRTGVIVRWLHINCMVP